MIIKRKLGFGCEINIALTDEEMRRAGEEYLDGIVKSEIIDVADSKGYLLPEDFPYDKVIPEIKHLRKKDENYQSAYWESIATAVYDELERMNTK